MDRRAFVTGAASFGVVCSAEAAQMVVGNTPLGSLQRAFVGQPTLIQQQCPEWCWAASSSMIFASRGHPVDQKKIVARVFNGLGCWPSGAGPLGPTGTITGVLDIPWIDDNGAGFQPTVVAGYDYFHGVVAINNAFIVSELQADRPLLYCNTHHAMVVVSVDYINTPMGPNVQAVGVLDPWPGSPGYHPLSPPEMVGAHMGGQMTYLAAIRV